MPIKLISKIKTIFNKNKVENENITDASSDELKEDGSPTDFSENSIKKELDSELGFPDYSHLKKSLLGKDNYLFLVNDVNNELRQHFDKDYENKFNGKKFRESYNSKKEYCEKKGIKYQFFLIPDKCLVCKEKLPFEVDFVKRNYDEVSDLFPDFMRNLKLGHYYTLDSHLNFLGGRMLSFNILRALNPEFRWAIFKEIFRDQVKGRAVRNRRGDLTLSPNLSYEEEELEIIGELARRHRNIFTEEVEDIPIEFAQTMKGMKFDRIGSPYLYLKDSIINLLQRIGFRKRDTRPTIYLKNPKSYTDKKVLIFRDSGATRVYPALSTYFKETLLYWDHWNFNKDLIEWYKPDIILEIRTERFIDLSDFEVV